MSCKGKIKYVFTSSNTCRGFHTFLSELLDGLKKVYVLKGAPGTGKSTFIRMLGEVFGDKGYEVEFWVSALDPVNPEGVYVPQLDAAVINGSLPCLIDPKYPGVTGDMIHLGDYINKKTIREHNLEIISLIDQMEAQNREAVHALSNAVRIKEEQKKTAAGHINLEKLHRLIQRITEELLEHNPQEKHYFASAVTAEGVINYVHEISAGCQKRYIFKGPLGSGKSTVLSELGRTAEEKGYRVEYYHCGLEPESLLMIIIPSLEVALIDAGQLEISPKPWDIEINMNDYLDDYDAEEVGMQQTEALRFYQTYMFEAQQNLERAHGCLKVLKRLYSGRMDFTLSEAKRREIEEEILRYEETSSL